MIQLGYYSDNHSKLTCRGCGVALCLLVTVKDQDGCLFQTREVYLAVFLKYSGHQEGLSWCTEQIFNDFSCFGVDSHTSRTFLCEHQDQLLRKVHDQLSQCRPLIEHIKEWISCGRNTNQQLSLFVELKIISVAEEIISDDFQLSLLAFAASDIVSADSMQVELRKHDGFCRLIIDDTIGESEICQQNSCFVAGQVERNNSSFFMFKQNFLIGKSHRDGGGIGHIDDLILLIDAKIVQSSEVLSIDTLHKESWCLGSDVKFDQSCQFAYKIQSLIVTGDDDTEDPSSVVEIVEDGAISKRSNDCKCSILKACVDSSIIRNGNILREPQEFFIGNHLSMLKELRNNVLLEGSIKWWKRDDLWFELRVIDWPLTPLVDSPTYNAQDKYKAQ